MEELKTLATLALEVISDRHNNSGLTRNLWIKIIRSLRNEASVEECNEAIDYLVRKKNVTEKDEKYYVNL